MKKQTLFLGMVLGILLVSATHSSMAYAGISTVSNPQEIPLEDRFRNPDNMRSGIIPITAKQQGDMLFIDFQEIVGVVEVTVTNNRGMNVFTETVNAATQPFLTISLQGLPSGSYVITFSSEKMKLRGEFEM